MKKIFIFIINSCRDIIFCVSKTQNHPYSLISFASLQYTFLLIIIFATTPIFAINNQSIDSTLNKSIIEKQEKELKIQYLLKKANDNFFNKNYNNASDQYLEAISLLTKNNKVTQKNTKRISEIKRSLALTYSAWAEEIFQKAEITSQKGDIKKAIELANQAVEINPKLKDQANHLKKMINQKELKIKFHDLTTDSKNKEINNKKSYNISVIFEQGKILFNKNELNRSKDKFEEILAVDPYNSKAIHYLNLINQKLYKDGQMRKNQMSAQRIADATWASVLPITSENFTGERIDISTGQIAKISRKDEKTSLEERLNEIIIPRISFDGVPAVDALLFLKDESKRLDPTGEGINLILRLNTNNPDEYKVDLTVNNMSLKKVIEYICEDAGINFVVKKYAVVISSGSASTSELITKVFPAEREDFGALLMDEAVTPSTAVPMEDYLTTRDINFPEGASAVYDLRISRLIVRNTPEELLKIKKVLKKLEEAVNPQVSIAAKFIEIRQTDFEELGFEWAVSRANSNFSFPGLSSAMRDAEDIGKSEVPIDRFFKFAVNQNDWDIAATIHALSQSEKVESLASPRVTTLNGYTTVIKVVTERYFPDSWSEPKIIETTANNATTSWLVSSVPTFGSATDIGIVLKVTPFVSSDNYTIDLIIEPMIQEFAGYNDNYTYEANLPYNNGNGGTSLYPVDYTQPMPIITNRSIKTRLQLYDGDTVVMGGAMKDKTTKYNDKIPIMGDIPLIGRFFQSEIEDVEKTNLLLFTTVRLIMPDGTPLRPIKTDGRANFPDTF
jgi:Flp pilus assembly secretin CpaC